MRAAARAQRGEERNVILEFLRAMAPWAQPPGGDWGEGDPL